MSQESLFSGSTKKGAEANESSAPFSARVGEEFNELQSKLSVLSARIRKGAEYLRNGDIPIEDRIKNQALFSRLCDEMSVVTDRLMGLIHDTELIIHAKGSHLELSAKVGGKEFFFVPAKTWLGKERNEITPKDIAFLSKIQRLFGQNIQDVKFVSNKEALDIERMFNEAAKNSGYVPRDYPLDWLDDAF